MAPSQLRLLPQNWQNRFLDLLNPLIKTLTRWGIHPNAFTLTGFVLNLVAAAALFEGKLRTGGLLILAIALDLLDIKRLPIGNLLPAVFVALLLVHITL